MICNGYEISGNLATEGRRYEVYDASGAVVHEADNKRLAVTWCEGATAGDVKPVEPPPPVAPPVAAPKKTVHTPSSDPSPSAAPKAAKKKSAPRTTKE